MRLLLPLLLLPSLNSMTVMESYERHLNDLTPPVLQKASPRGPMRVKRYKCVEEYVDLPVSSTSESLSIFSHPLPPLNPNQDPNQNQFGASYHTQLNSQSAGRSFPLMKAGSMMQSGNSDGSFLSRSTGSIDLMENSSTGSSFGSSSRAGAGSVAPERLMESENNGDEQLQRVEADHGAERSEEMMFFSDSAPPATRPTPPRQTEPSAVSDSFSPSLSQESEQPSPPPFSPQFLPPSFAISSSPFIQLPPPNTIASSRPLSQIRVPASTGRALPPPRPVQQLHRLHSGGRSLDGDRELPDLDFSEDERPNSQPAPPSAPPLFSRSAAAAAPAATRLPYPPLFISPTPLPPLPDFGAAPTFSISQRDEEKKPALLAHPHQSDDVEDISVVPLNPSNPARGPKAIMRHADGKKHPPLNSNESEDTEPPREFVSYNAKTFRTFNRNATRPSFKSVEPTEKLWTFSSWKAEEV